MNIQGMHIGVDQYLQNISSNRNRNILPEEIDFHLNIAIPQFVKSKIKRGHSANTGISLGYQHDIVDTSAIEPLISGITPVPLVKGNNAIYNSLDVKYPADCLVPVSLYLQTLPRDCIKEGEPIFIAKKFTYYNIRLDQYEQRETNIIKKLEFGVGSSFMELEGEGTSDPTYLKLAYIGLKYMLKQNDINIDIAWENNPLTGGYSRNTIILIVPEALPAGQGPLLTIDGQDLPTIQLERQIEIINPNIETTRSPIHPRIYTVRTDKLSSVMESSFARSSVSSVVSVLSDNTTTLLYDENFIILRAGLSYIRKPQEVSLSLGIDSDLPDLIGSRDEVVKLASNNIKQLIITNSN